MERMGDTPATEGAEEMANATARVRIGTTLGEITVELYGVDAPVTVDNFLHYVRSGTRKALRSILPLRVRGHWSNVTTREGIM